MMLSEAGALAIVPVSFDIAGCLLNRLDAARRCLSWLEHDMPVRAGVSRGADGIAKSSTKVSLKAKGGDGWSQKATILPSG
jgi:hypothetical protein